jgi:hypothetical protein
VILRALSVGLAHLSLELVKPLVEEEQVLDQVADGLLVGQLAAAPETPQVGWGMGSHGSIILSVWNLVDNLIDNLCGSQQETAPSHLHP